MAIPMPEQVALARRRYIEGVPVGAIVAEIGATSLRIVYRCFDGEFPDGSGISPAPIPRRRAGVRLYRSGSRRTALVTRLWRAAEQQVLVGSGSSGPQAAHALGISRETVKTHLARCFEKMGLRSQVELARLLSSLPLRSS